MRTTTWRKSSFSGANGSCVVMGELGPDVGLKDSKLGDSSPTLALDRDAVAALIEGIKAGA